MKKIFLITMLLASNLKAEFAGTITTYQNSTLYSYGNGGEFESVSPELGIFHTFCIEHGEYFYPGLTYNFRKNTGAVKGGLSGGNDIDGYTGYSMDNISIGTAWLYSQFREGTLLGYDYNYGVGRKDSANKLQQSIWWLEGENDQRPVNGFIDLAEQFLNKNDDSIRENSMGAFGVVALNIFDDNNNVAQDLLAIDNTPTISVPESKTNNILILTLLLMVGFYKKYQVKLKNVN